MEDNNLYLVYVNPVGKDSNDLFEYEFFFSETPENVWGEDWNIACPAACGDTLPDPTTYSEVKIIKTDIPLFCVQQNTCFSLQDCIDGIVCLAFSENENIFTVFNFNENYLEVMRKINIFVKKYIFFFIYPYL